MSQKKVSHKTYHNLLSEISGVLQEARKASARAVNTILTVTYWEIGRQIVKFEQKGNLTAAYGEEIVGRLAVDLTKRFGRGFSRRNLFQMRMFYVSYARKFQIVHGLSRKQKVQTPSAQLPEFSIKNIRKVFPLSWSQYVRLLSVKDSNARDFYETEAIRGGWSVRQLDRQINSQFYERVLLSRKKSVMLKKGEAHRSEDVLTPEEEIKDPTVLEFLNLKDEYSESELEDALIHKLEDFLLEMGYGFTFVARQKRLCIDDEWYRIDLLLYHRKLRCLIVIDLKIGKFTHVDAGQMNLYLNYVAENMTMPEENPPVGIILCSQKREAVAHYALSGLRSKVLTSEYRLQLPNKKELETKLKKAQMELEKLKH